jgi:hypothetical protein
MSEVTNHVLLVDTIMVLKSVYIDTRSVQMFLAQRIASRCNKYTYHSKIYVCDVQLMLWVLMMAQSFFLALLGLEVLSDKCSPTAASPTQKKEEEELV